jgi:hypothetical protein
MSLFIKSLALGAVLFSFNSASASFMESCDFEASVVSVSRIGVLGEQVSSIGRASGAEDTYTHIMNVQIIAVTKDLGQASCDRHLDQPFQIVIKAADRFKAGDVLKLNYTYANSLTPQGVASMVRWQLQP